MSLQKIADNMTARALQMLLARVARAPACGKSTKVGTVRAIMWWARRDPEHARQVFLRVRSMRLRSLLLLEIDGCDGRRPDLEDRPVPDDEADELDGLNLERFANLDLS